MEISPLVRALLAKRGVESEEHVAAFLNPDYEAHTHDPALLHDMEKAVARLFTALSRGERICLYTDFDCDGIAGAVVLSDFFKKIGYDNVETYLPHRDLEGYGFHEEAVRAIASREVTLIITADVGTTATEACESARSLGVDVIVTDHHEVMGEIPEATAVVNPKLGGYPFPHLCGASVAFKLVQAALSEGRRRGIEAFLSVPEGWEKWLLDVVAIATVADMVPLVGENRALLYWGLEVLRKSSRPGVDALCSAARLRQRELTEDDIGFSLAPRLNAASRMDEPELAFSLLTTQDPLEGARLAQTLERLNASRKGVVAGIVKEARKRAKERFGKEDLVAVLGDTSWKPALLGLAANSIVGDRGGVVCLWGKDGAGALKGSCRSDGSLSLVDLFAAAPDAFERYGGHAHSGGFTISHERVHTLHEQLSRAARDLPRVPAEKREHEASLSLSSVSVRTFAEVSRLAPFGVGNPKPLFLVPQVRVGGVRRFGREGSHVEVMLEADDCGFSVRAFEFFKTPEAFTLPPAPGVEASVVATLERDSFRGGFALRLVDVLPRA